MSWGWRIAGAFVQMRDMGAADQRAVAFAAAKGHEMGKNMNYDLEAARLKKDWAENPRWKGIKRGFSAEDVVRLRGSVHIEHTLARRGAEKLWKLVNEEPFVNSLGAMTGNQAMQQVKAGLKAIYLSGWQVAADANVAGEMYPDQSLYPINSVPNVVKRINNTFLRAVAIAAVIGAGLMALSGRIQWMTFIGVMLAVVIIFGSAGIVDYIRDNSATAALDPVPVFGHVV